MTLMHTFHRKTRRGNILKVVREHYLRDDIGCGMVDCPVCNLDEESPSILSPLNRSCTSSTSKSPYLIVVDSSVALGQIDILEDSFLTDVILPQTVLEEVKRRNPPIYKRLNAIFGRKEKRFYYLYNEFHQDTYTEWLPGDTKETRSIRAIQNVLKWYQKHMKKFPKPASSVKIIFLTDNDESMQSAKENGILVYTMSEYVNGVSERPDLIDKLAAVKKDEAASNASNKKGAVLYSEHKSMVDLRAGLKSGKYKQGCFQVSRENYLEANIFVNGEEKEQVFIQGLMNFNRAMHDDAVVVEMLPKDQWSCPASVLKLQDMEKDRGDELNPDEDEEIKQFVPKTGEQVQMLPTGRVVGILRRNWRPMCGILDVTPVAGTTRHLFIPSERRLTRVRIETKQAEVLKGQRIVVAIDCWPKDSRYPCGHFVRALGPLGDRQTENEVLLLEHDVPYAPFSSAVLACLPDPSWKLTDDDLVGREDLRHLDICSIDPPGCTDIDDALHCIELEDGNLEVGVHIADVSHFVKPSTAMDAEAKERGTTVYLVDRRIDMLPQLLSSNICSLRGGEDRLAFSAIWKMTKKGDILSTRFCKSAIRSKAAMTYSEAQFRIDDATLQDKLTRGLRQLNKLAKKLKHRRMARGALTLASLEIRFKIDSETHDPIDVQAKQMLETNSLVEEFMLLANISVAERITEEFPDCALLRRHPSPAQSNYDALVKAAAARGFKIDVENGKTLADSLDNAVIEANPFFNTLLRMLTTRCMTQARYFSSGTVEPAEFLHFGLASPIYTHFTSPIRRYADLVVHRLLGAAIGVSSTYAELLDVKCQEAMCQKLNYRHKMAQYAGRASVLINTHMFFKDKSENLEGYIVFIRRNAFQVLIPKYGLESAVLMKENCPLQFQEETVSLKGPGRLTMRMFDRVLVRLSMDSSNVQHQRLKLELIEPKVPGFSVEPIIDTTDNDTEPPAKRKRKC